MSKIINRRPADVGKVAALLSHRYSDFAHYNKKNPLDELLFIMLSITTTWPVYMRTYKALKSRFPRHEDLAIAPIEEIARAIKEGGQYFQKAIALKGVLNALILYFGRPTLAPLNYLSDSDCEEFLTSLPRIGLKVARCVLMYSLGRKVFPVDTHCWRISKRLGWVRSHDVRPNSVDELQKLVSPNLRFSIHVNFISLGREFCRAKTPICIHCPLACLCPSVDSFAPRIDIIGPTSFKRHGFHGEIKR